jgi:hypothetical protein
MIGQRQVSCAIGALVIVLTWQGAEAQLTYSRGQNISPAYEGWEKNEDGSFNFLFGYMNRNWEEELDIPIGADNNIQPGEFDQGQPTHFLPRRNRFVFRVRVPKDFGEKELTWTLTVRGKTERAYATLRQDYFVDNLVQASEHGALGAGASNPSIRANKAPVLKIDGEQTRRVKVGEPLTLVAWVTDDGVPKPRQRTFASSFATPSDSGGSTGPRMNPAWRPPSQITVGSATGLRVSWFVYRGAGKVTFAPDQIKVWEDTRSGANSPWAPRWMAPPPPEDGKWETQVTFDQPGTYMLRCLAADGALGTDRDVTVTVTSS